MTNESFIIHKKHLELGSDLKTSRKNLESLDFEADINILALQPGVGKTHKIKKYLQENDNWVITVPNYKLINSEYESIVNLNGVKQWKGFNKVCPKFIKGNKHVKELKNKYNLGPSIVCRNACKPNEWKECVYKNQFKHSDKVVTVSAYYNTSYFYKDGEFKFDIAIVDEELSGYELIRINKEEIDLALEKIYNDYIDFSAEFPDFYGPDFRPDFQKIIEDKNLFSNQFETEMGSIVFYAMEDDQKLAIEEAIKDQKWEDVNIIKKLNIPKLKKWLYYYNIYSEIRDYGEPNIYKLFDLARQGVKVIFSDATFSEEIFNRILERYEFEDNKIPRSELFKKYINPKDLTEEAYKAPKFSKEVKINVYNSNLQNKENKVFWMWNTNQFTRGYVDPKILEFIRKAKRRYNNIGIISYKELKDRKYIFDVLGEFIYFGDLRGVNSFEDKDAIFMIGTPFTNPTDALNDYNALFVENEKETIKLNLKSKESDELNLDYYQRYLVEAEIYQAIHRTRPFGKTNKTIFVFGNVLSKIKEEFNVLELNKEQTEQYFEEAFKGVMPTCLVWSLFSYCMKHPNVKVTDVAKEFKLYKDSSKGSYNTKIITAVKRGKLNIENAQKITNLILDGTDNLKSIKKKYPKLELEDSILESLIYYSKEGDFIKLNDSI